MKCCNWLLICTCCIWNTRKHTKKTSSGITLQSYTHLEYIKNPVVLWQTICKVVAILSKIIPLYLCQNSEYILSSLVDQHFSPSIIYKLVCPVFSITWDVLNGLVWKQVEEPSVNVQMCLTISVNLVSIDWTNKKYVYR